MTAPRKIVVGVAVPSGGMMHTDCAMSLAAMTARSAGTAIKRGGEACVPSLALLNEQSCYVAANRNGLVQKAYAAGCEYLLFVDSDMVFGSDALLRLLDVAIKRGLDIVGGNYTQRTPPYESLAIGLPATAEGLVQAESLPTGFLLVRMSVFDRVPFPWFQTPYVMGANGEPELLGEDRFFCAIALKAGFRIWVDTELSRTLGHLGQKCVQWAGGDRDVTIT